MDYSSDNPLIETIIQVPENFSKNHKTDDKLRYIIYIFVDSLVTLTTKQKGENRLIQTIGLRLEWIVIFSVYKLKYPVS